MQEFSSISVSSYEAGTLADRLGEQSRDGWAVVAIVPTGSTVTAYLSREAEATTDHTEATADVAATAADVTAVDQSDADGTDADGTDDDAAESDGTDDDGAAAVSEAPGWAAGAAATTAATATPSTDATDSATADTATADTAQPTPQPPTPQRHRPRRLPPTPLPPPAQHRPAGTPTRHRDSNSATGTAPNGPSTCHTPASSTPTRPSPDPADDTRQSSGRPVPSPPCRVTSIGHAGMLIETDAGSILCDPWFVPAFFGSWFVFPRNDRLSDDLRQRIEDADFLYVTHLHADHHDEPWLREHLRRDIPILLPGYPTREQRRTLARLGFTNFVPTVDGEEMEIAPGLTIAIHTEVSITDGPGGDSAMMASDGHSRLVNQNDCRTTDLDALRSHGPVDLHWLQYSGAIWYPMVYDMPDDDKRELCEAKVDSQFTRAMKYVEAIDARAVVPSAGPPAFLDPDLFHLNVIDGNELSIFPDQRSFLALLDERGRRGQLAIPGTEFEIGPDGIDVTHPIPDADVAAIFDDKARYLSEYQADWLPWLDEMKSQWPVATSDLRSTLAAWWEPLLRMAPTLCGAVGANCLVRAGDLELLIDFPNAEVRAFAGEPYSFRFDIPRPLVELVTEQPRRRLVELVVPVVPLDRMARGRLQRVPLQLLQVAVGRADASHRGGSDPQARPTDGDRGRDRDRRLRGAAPLPASQCGSVGVR